VLISFVARPQGATVLLTQRSHALSHHAGQIAFPGGRIEPSDASPLAAALRETEEEIGLTREAVTPLGYLDPYFTGSGYRILPVVAIVTPPFALVIDPAEVDEAFEVPAGFLMDPANHLWHLREREGRTRGHYAMPFGERYIWGATAGILRNLYEKLYA
jgi:8-oxo-dGTP pyrophosphatase MutT (NUDIX family)